MATRSLVAPALLVPLLVAGCGKPENSAYTHQPQSEAQEAALSAPLPAEVPWASTVMGRPISALVHGSTVCKGAVDLNVRHAPKTGPKGYELQGWAWDAQGKAAPARVLLIDATSKVVGAGDVGRVRPDVPQALPSVTTPKVGWTLVAHAPPGPATLVAVSAAGALCTIAPAPLT